MSSLMMKAAMVLFASLLSGGKPSAAKNRADAARSLTGRLTAILVDIGASVVVAGEFCFVEERREWKCGRLDVGCVDRVGMGRGHGGGRRSSPRVFPGLPPQARTAAAAGADHGDCRGCGQAVRAASGYRGRSSAA